ncbi:MAG: biotin-dependent carboxyltransferase family protein [Devosia sp.]|nr:biotin-dependent carboxyltransferase family protein [Devosia sp.]
MSAAIEILRAGPLVTVQDAGRFGMLAHGISASGPMDRAAFVTAGRALPIAGAAIEFTRAGLSFRFAGDPVQVVLAGGAFELKLNGHHHDWPEIIALSSGDLIDITPGSFGNYGYLRFSQEFDLPPILGSRSTNTITGLGGFYGRSLQVGDRLSLVDGSRFAVETLTPGSRDGGSIRVTWGLHADHFSGDIRQLFLDREMTISTRLNRMGVRLDGGGAVFGGASILSLVSDSIVPGDIQILGDGTPIVLMRDHQPTGGYPRIATIIAADLDRFAQLRPGTAVRFKSVAPACVLKLGSRG